MSDLDEAVDPLTALAYAAGSGDRDALSDLVRLTQQDLHRFLATLAAPGEAADLTQETYLRAMRALPRFGGRSSIRTWLFSIARRVAADHFRQASRRPLEAAVPDWEASANAAHTRSRSRFEEHHALSDLIRGLPDERREAFLLTQVAGLSYAEVAEICECPIGTIRSRIARAREDLVDAMRDRDWHDARNAG
ncbi:sigma-70 family RNA polymerase sigma factor [Micromonosporaceae bacterium Da 78-11]